MAQAINVGTQYGDDIFGKIKQMIDNGCTEVILTRCEATPQEEGETIYKTDVVGLKDD